MAIVALESIDAGGKGTQVEALVKHFTPKFRKVETLHFPVYDTLTGQAIKGYLQGKWFVTEHDDFEYPSKELDALALQSLMVTNRLEMFRVLKEHETSNRWPDYDPSLLILDRYNASAIAYGLADGLSRDFLDRIHEPLPKPAHYFYLDITVDESFRRRPERQDAYESNRERLEQVRLNYLDIFQNSGPTYHIIDGTQAADAVSRDIINIIEGV